MRADELADSILTMCSVNGGSPTVPGLDPRENGEQAIRSSLITDAEEFMSLDPERLEDEFGQQVRAGQQTKNPESGADISYAQDVLDPNVWSGTAAKAFHKQLSYMRSFVDQ